MRWFPKFFLICFSITTKFLLAAPSGEEAKEPLTIMTVNGPVPASKLGVVLPHEHFLVDFVGADKVSRDRYRREDVVRVALPILNKLKNLGCSALFECTPAYMGRDPELYRELAKASSLHIITNTGFCGAWENKFLPSYALTETAGQLADRLVKEWEKGIDDTEIRPGFIKICVDPGRLSGLHQKIVKAAALAHLKTGLTIASHTGPAAGAFEQIEILKSEGVDPSAFIWVHAQVEKDKKFHLEAAAKGCWVSFDGLRGDDIAAYVDLLSNMKSAGLLDRVLLSHDAVCYFVGQPGGGQPFSYTRLFGELVPSLKKSGFADAEIDQLIARNPQNAYAIRIRAFSSFLRPHRANPIPRIAEK